MKQPPKWAWDKAMEIVQAWLKEDCGERQEVVDSMKGAMKLTHRIAWALVNQKADG